MLVVTGEGELNGAVLMGGGDDTVVVHEGAVIADTMFGGETNEVNGDLLIIGSETFCREDAGAYSVSESLNALNPDGGSVTFAGQHYTWAEFERIASGMHFEKCFPSIDDGRINNYDLAAPAALYCAEGGGVIVYDIDLEGNGTRIFAVRGEQLRAGLEAALATGRNSLVMQDGHGHAFWALSSSEFAFTAPEDREPWKQYQFIFQTSRCGTMN
jgi:hypothetical protein